MSSMGEEADKTEEARRAHSSSVSLLWGLAQAKLGTGDMHAAHYKPQNRDTGSLQHAQGIKLHKGSICGAAPAQTSQGCCHRGPCSVPGPSQPSPAPYWGVVLHDGVVQLVALAGSPREEAGLADIHIELLQAPIPAEVKRP